MRVVSLFVLSCSRLWAAAVIACIVWPVSPAQSADDLTRQPGVVGAEFIYEDPPPPSCHASTMAETPDGLVAAWFGGKAEGSPTVGIWFARRDENHWSRPVEVANGIQADGKRFPCWNPVLFQPRGGPLMLFYKVGPRPSAWWGMLVTSDGGGRTWDKPRRLPEGMIGPVKNKPILLANGRLLCGSSTEHDGWRVHFETTSDLGKTWERTDDVDHPHSLEAIQPTLLAHPGGKLQALCRTRQRVIAETWSSDGGKTWSPLAATDLPNPNSGIDAVTLVDGRHLLVYNPTRGRRSPLDVALSTDGAAWQTALVLENEPGEYSYPAVVQTADGNVHISYTWKRQRVRHWTIDPRRLETRPLSSGK